MTVSINFRPHGYVTEQLGAADVAPRRENQKTRLLRTYVNAPLGLTDDEAAQEADLEDTCYWKRCGELRELGYIATLTIAGVTLTKMGLHGSRRIVCWITDEGEKHLEGRT
jgi:hypothetical protein